MLGITGDGCEVAGLGVRVRGAAAVRFASEKESRILCAIVSLAGERAARSRAPDDARLRAGGWDPQEFRRVNGSAQSILHDVLTAETLDPGRVAAVSRVSLPSIYESLGDTEPGSFEELRASLAGLALDAEPDLGGAVGLLAVAPPLPEERRDALLSWPGDRRFLALSPQLPLPTVIENCAIEIPGWLLCLFGPAVPLARMARVMAERRLLAEAQRLVG